MTLMSVITGDAPAVLFARMAQDLAAAPLAPLDEECIVVQSLGMDRWLRQQFARTYGCAASLAMPFPAAFCRRLASTLQRDRRFATGDGVSIDTRFEEQALTWRVFTRLADRAFLAQPVNAPLRSFLEGATDAKRFGLAQRITACFDEYRLYRPERVITWEAQGASPDAGEHEQWQAALWRTLLGNERPAHFARWFLQTIERLESIADRPVGLPTRVSVFGVSTLPPLFVRLLRALARFVPVRFYVLMPQARGWEPHRVGHPLFEAFGHSSRDFVRTLVTEVAPVGVEHVDRGPWHAPETPTLLQQLQHGLRSGIAPPFAPDSHDRSVTVHVCHSPLRELEVLRDQLLDAFANDPTLRPHDVLVMAPDVEPYAALAEVIFGQRRGADADERPAIPYRIADRTLARESAPATALAGMLQLVTSRLAASEVLALLSQPLVREAAGVAPAQMDQITRWVEDAAIRWGHDGPTRAAWHGVPPFGENSWRTGLDRLLAGYATGQVDALVGDVAPLAGDLAGDVELLGHFVTWVEQLAAWVDVLRGERRLADWPPLLQQGLDWLVAPTNADDRAATDRLRSDLARLAAQDTAQDAAQPVAFEVVREWVMNLLSDDEQASGFLTGGLTLCAMKPMRAIPHRIIAMLGLDDRAFPRRQRRPAFDLIGADPQRGDRDPRADDRQLVLDTLLSAGDRLILSYVGRSQENNAEIAPSVVLSELLDGIDRLAPGGALPSRQLRVEHRLQPFSPVYFAQHADRDARLFSFDTALARSLTAGDRMDAPPFLPTLPPVPVLVRDAHTAVHAPPLELTVNELVDAWLDPARVYCRRVLQVTVAGDDPLIEDVEPMTVDALQRTIEQQRMLDRTLQGRSEPVRERVLAAASGHLPAAALGTHWHYRLRDELSPLLARVGGAMFLDPLPVEVRGADWTVRGHLDLPREGEQWRVRAGKLTSRDKARAWVLHLVRCAAASPVPTVVIARDKELVLPPLNDALAQLDMLVQGVRALHTAPLPYFLEAACVYRSKARRGDTGALVAAQQEYRREPGFGRGGGDGCDPYVQLLWRGRDPVVECAEAFVACANAFWERFDEVTGA
ncbi:MAG: exodeoxyribonuclease V subunit gamma [Gemmatimonas sp.]|uniref:exodeoxyribonuclease V subunit gamma n=1 Tax=Gemmatimonas sp. TaxID=1962908 RepID=UPI00391F2925